MTDEAQAELFTTDTGTPFDEVEATNSSVEFDSLFAGDFFTGIRTKQPDVDTFCTTQGIPGISVALWGLGTRSADVNINGKGFADQNCPRGMSSVLPANIEGSFILRPADGHSFSFFIDPRKFSETFQDDDPAGKVAEVHTNLFGRDEFLFRMAEEYLREFAEDQHFSSIALETVAMRVCLHLARNYSSRGDNPIHEPRSLVENERMVRVKEYIEAHLHEPITLAEIARVACLSQYHFSRSFKATEGVSPYQYVVRQRLTRAQCMIVETNLPLSEIAFLCGFSSQQHMTELFRKGFGTTPGAIRKSTTWSV